MKKSDNIRIILASASPRRRELIRELFSDIEVVVAEVDEELPDGIHPSEGVELLAIRKGAAVASKLGESALVISADTLVEMDGIPLGKPRDEDEAIKMLSALSARSHNVHTGVALHYRGRLYSGVDTTSVVFRALSMDEIREYVNSGEPMDKAGAYGIQGMGGRFVAEYNGDFDTVVGLSMRLVRRLYERAMEERND